MQESFENFEKQTKRKYRILQSTFARLRRKVAKNAKKKHKIKEKRESEARANGLLKRMPKEKRKSRQ